MVIDTQPESKVLAELVRRTVDAVRPLRIVLFGSAARGEMGPNSDLDVLVIMPNGSNCRAAAQTLYHHLGALGCAKDILVFQQCDIEQYGDNPSLIIHTALTEGKELYHAAG